MTQYAFDAAGIACQRVRVNHCNGRLVFASQAIYDVALAICSRSGALVNANRQQRGKQVLYFGGP